MEPFDPNNDDDVHQLDFEEDADEYGLEEDVFNDDYRGEFDDMRRSDSWKEIGLTPSRKSVEMIGKAFVGKGPLGRQQHLLIGSVIVFAIVVLFIIVGGIAIYAATSTTNSSHKSVIELTAAEKTLLSAIHADDIKKYLHTYCDKSHVAGSQNDHATATFTREEMLSLGGVDSSQVEEVPVILNYPIHRTVRSKANASSSEWVYAALKEDAVEQDPTSSDPNVTPTFNGYSASGNVTGQVVYVNYGRMEDYQELLDRNINLTGKVVLARYGKGFRGNKAALAETFGASAVLIYSDPADDGFARGEVYPDGPWRPAWGVQRGSVWTGNGDPATPGWPSTPRGPRLTTEQASDPSHEKLQGYEALPSIPIQPLSWADAKPLLENLRGTPAISDDWIGAVPGVSYNVGPGPALANVDLSMNFSTTPIWNVIGWIEGAVEPDRLVVLGNHRDAWVFGGVDPNSGSSTMLSMISAFGQVLKTGWRPRRTIVFASWDAEEYGLVGSMEWVETHSKLLDAQGVVYLNVDTGVSGSTYLSARGNPQISALARDLAQVVMVEIEGEERPVSDLWDGHVGALGSGSDFTGFLQQIGMPAFEFEFSDTEGSYEAVYHSIYDSIYWTEQFGDPDFSFHRALGQLWGLLAMRFADQPVLPMRYEGYGNALHNISIDVEDAIRDDDVVTDADVRAQLLDSFAVLNASIEAFASVARVLDDHTKNAEKNDAISELELRRLNDVLMRVERSFIDPSGTLGRLQLQHVIFAPGVYNSYAGEKMPGIYHALHGEEWDEASFQMLRIAQMIDQAAEMMASYDHGYFAPRP